MSGMRLYRAERRPCGEKLRVKWAHKQFRNSLFSLGLSVICGLVVLVTLTSLTWIVFHALYIADAHQSREVGAVVRRSLEWYDQACPETDEFRKLSEWQTTCKDRREELARLTSDALTHLQPTIIRLTQLQIQLEADRYVWWLPVAPREAFLACTTYTVGVLLRDRNQWYAITTGLAVALLFLLYLRVFTLDAWLQLNDVWGCVEETTPGSYTPYVTPMQRMSTPLSTLAVLSHRKTQL